MKNRCFGLVLLLFVFACGRGRSFSDIKKGDQAKNILSHFGSPESRRKMGSTEWWQYNDQDRHVLIINADTVVNTLTQEQAMQIMRETLQLADSLHLK